ncbi:hypothetical protein MTR_6g059740 [Medicago truncatula]|uniref:Uncharacterized protein n=1 Tax=Medicago truncatula TaxID=3880 RepID=G7KMU8_MEDTR|nr:hypothetical protein MTR_6g059740 [Medicago truncatula]
MFVEKVINVDGGSTIYLNMYTYVDVFVRFRLSDQLRSSANPINDFGVVNVAYLERWVFRRLEYSHMCRLLYFAVLCY